MDKWNYREGKAKLSLVLNTLPNLPLNIRNGSSIRVKITATGILDSGSICNRLIHDWYYTTDEPFTNDPKLWESRGPDTIEYGLGGIDIHQSERLVIGMQVLTPNIVVQNAKPRLKLAADYDYAIDEHIPLLRLIGNIALILSVVAAMFLLFICWHKKGK